MFLLIVLWQSLHIIIIGISSRQNCKWRLFFPGSETAELVHMEQIPHNIKVLVTIVTQYVVHR